VLEPTVQFSSGSRCCCLRLLFTASRCTKYDLCGLSDHS
jgi:hypothetical protein